jgi:hypothetical protein
MSLVNRVAPFAVRLCIVMMPMACAVQAAETPKSSPSEQQVPVNKAELDAVEVARATLARALYVPEGTLPVLSIEPRSWANSGLGCATPDTATINIGRRGYAVALATPDGVRHVHVAGRQSRICDLPPKSAGDMASAAEQTVSPPPPYDLNTVVARSREDLARRLKAPVSSVRLVSFVASTWPDNTMACAVPYEQTRKKTVKGYQIQLQQGGRNYVYHTDLVRTRACPSVELAAPASAKNYEIAAKSPARRGGGTKKIATAAAPPDLGIVQRYPSP